MELSVNEILYGDDEERINNECMIG